MKAIKFTQIACTYDGEGFRPPHTLYGLGEDGVVYRHVPEWKDSGTGASHAEVWKPLTNLADEE